MTQEIWVFADEVQIGDVVTEFERIGWDLCPVKPVVGAFEVKVLIDNDSAQYLDSRNSWVNVSKGKQIRYHVKRGEKAVKPSAKPDSLWNGTCIRCGKGTYQGAWKLEHDGPCQPVRK